MRAHIIDYETETNPWYGQVASAYCPENYIVLEAGEDIDFGNGSTVIHPRYERRYESVEDWRSNWKGLGSLEGVNILVAHNALYEMHWWLQHDYAAFTAFLKRGGRVYCTAYAHYLLSNQQDIYPALNDTAPLYGGTSKVDAVKAMWEAGVKTSDIDPALLSEYLSGPCGDIENTRHVFLGTWAALQERKMLTMALVRMDGLLFSAFAMHHGLLVDTEQASKLQRENEEALEKLHSQVFATFPADMPQAAIEQFKFTSGYHKSALIFGGVYTYEAQVSRTDSEGNLIYVKADGPFFKDGKDTYCLSESECVFDEDAGGLWYDPARKIHQARYSAGKRKGEPKFDKYVTDVVDTKKGEMYYVLTGMLNVKQREALWSAIETEWAGKQTLYDGSPVISSSGDVLDKLVAHGVEGVRPLQLISKIEKDLGSFFLVETFNKDGSLKKQSGMLQYVQPDNCIHHSLNHTSTVTTRLSSNKPNLQQLPRAEEVREGDFKSKVKTIFVSRFGKDGGILQEDYSALETVGLQVFTQDPALKVALLKGLDMHSIRLASMEGLDYDYVVARTKDDKHPDHAEWDVKRTGIKPVAFQYQYGATAYGMAMSTGKSQEFCQAFIDAEKAAFPVVESWFENSVFKAVEDSAAKRKPTRVQLDTGYYMLYRTGVYISPDGTTFEFREHTKSRFDFTQKKRIEVNEFTVPQMRNYPIQGGSGLFVQMACGMLIRHFIANDFYGGKCLPINTVHDAAYFDTHKDVVVQAALEIECIMESIPEMLNKLWPAYNCEVPFLVSGGFGPNMAVEDKVYTDKTKWLADKKAWKKQYLAAKGIEAQF